MAKICPSCGRKQTDERIVKCEKCLVAFEEEQAKATSKDDIKRVALEIRRSKIFWLTLVGIIVAPIWLGLALIDYFLDKKAKHFLGALEERTTNTVERGFAQVSNNIAKAFEEP